MALIEFGSHFLNTLKSKCTGVPYCKPLGMYVGGEGGTGNSRRIDATRDYVRAYGKPNEKQTIAPKGIDAINENEKIVHSFF